MPAGRVHRVWRCPVSAGIVRRCRQPAPASALSRRSCWWESGVRLASQARPSRLRPACAPWLRVLLRRRPPPRPSLRSPSGHRAQANPFVGKAPRPGLRHRLRASARACGPLHGLRLLRTAPAIACAACGLKSAAPASRWGGGGGWFWPTPPPAPRGGG
jgi:hypothetical protein